jgi:hypothetical protein
MHEMPGSQNLYLIAYLIEYPVKQKQLLVSFGRDGSLQRC